MLPKTEAYHEGYRHGEQDERARCGKIVLHEIPVGSAMFEPCAKAVTDALIRARTAIDQGGEYERCPRCGETIPTDTEMDGCRDPDCPTIGRG